MELLRAISALSPDFARALGYDQARSMRCWRKPTGSTGADRGRALIERAFAGGGCAGRDPGWPPSRLRDRTGCSASSAASWGRFGRGNGGRSQTRRGLRFTGGRMGRSSGRVRRPVAHCRSRRPLRRGRGRRRSSRAGRHRGERFAEVDLHAEATGDPVDPDADNRGLPREYRLRPVPSPAGLVPGVHDRCRTGLQPDAPEETRKAVPIFYCSRPLASCGAGLPRFRPEFRGEVGPSGRRGRCGGGWHRSGPCRSVPP